MNRKHIGSYAYLNVIVQCLYIVWNCNIYFSSGGSNNSNNNYINNVSKLLLLTPKNQEQQYFAGLNEPWIMEYLMELNIPCAACPTNIQKRTIEEISCRLNDMVLNQRVGVFREILPFALLQPYKSFNNSENVQVRKEMRKILSLYAQVNASVILSFDRPIPTWMGPSSSWCPIPPLSNHSAWNQLRNSISSSLANFIYWLSSPNDNDYGIDMKKWIHTHLILEPWNEFDAVMDTNCKFPSNAPSASRAADLHSHIVFALEKLSFTKSTMPIHISPSISGAQGSWVTYISDYYNAGGGGLPNIHWYGCNASHLEEKVKQVEKIIPKEYIGKLVLGETGCSRVTKECKSINSTTVGTESTRQTFFMDVTKSLRKSCIFVLFWRVMELTNNKPPLGCEASFGITTANNVAYDKAGTSFFQLLGGTGLNQSC